MGQRGGERPERNQPSSGGEAGRAVQTERHPTLTDVFKTQSQIKYTLLNYTNKAYFMYVYVVPVCLYSKGLLEFDKIPSLDSGKKTKKSACLSVLINRIRCT